MEGKFVLSEDSSSDRNDNYKIISQYWKNKGSDMKYEPAKNKPQLGRGRENSSDNEDEDLYQFDDFEPPSATDRKAEQINMPYEKNRLSAIEELKQEESKKRLNIVKKIDYSSTVINLDHAPEIDNSSEEENKRETDGNEEQFGNCEYEDTQENFPNNHREEDSSEDNQLVVDNNQYQYSNHKNEEEDKGEAEGEGEEEEEETEEEESEDNQYFHGDNQEIRNNESEDQYNQLNKTANNKLQIQGNDTFNQYLSDPYQIGSQTKQVERSRDEDLYDLMQNSLHQDVNLNKSYDFDIDPSEEVGNALIQKPLTANIEEQTILSEKTDQKTSSKNEEIKIIENDVITSTVKRSSNSKDNSFIVNQIHKDNLTHKIEESNIETGEIDIESLSKRPGTHHQK